MTKRDFAEAIHRRIGLSKSESAEIVEFFFDVIKEELEAGETVKIPKFGSFRVKTKRSRRGRNPVTGEAIEITRRRAVVFKPSKILREIINE